MIVLSWDVGIIHLAYCILDCNGHVPKILDWDTIDLIDKDKYRHRCCGVKKNGEKCGNNSSKKMESGSGIIRGFCNVHADQHKKYLDVSEIHGKYVETSDGVCGYIKKDSTICGKAAKKTDGTAEGCLCNIHHKQTISKMIKKLSLHPVEKICVKKIPTSLIQNKLVRKMDELLEYFIAKNVDHVIIENQPAKKNGKMKSVACTLYDYFMIRGQIDNINGWKIETVKFINASNKLKIDAVNTDKILSAEKKKMKNKQDRAVYNATKDLGIIYTKKALKSEPLQLEYLNLFKKQDDLCDAYLQAIYYHSKN